MPCSLSVYTSLNSRLNSRPHHGVVNPQTSSITHRLLCEHGCAVSLINKRHACQCLSRFGTVWQPARAQGLVAQLANKCMGVRLCSAHFQPGSLALFCPLAALAVLQAHAVCVAQYVVSLCAPMHAPPRPHVPQAVIPPLCLEHLHRPYAHYSTANDNFAAYVAPCHIMCIRLPSSVQVVQACRPYIVYQ